MFNGISSYKILTEIGLFLSYLHARKYAHFDIKPQNIFLDDKYTPKIADFGLTKFINDPEKCRASGCSLYYSPPEQIISNKSDFSSDV